MSARHDRRMEFAAWGMHSRIGHSTLRQIEQYFSVVEFFEGAPFVPWTAVRVKLKQGLTTAVTDYFNGELLIVENGTKVLSTSTRREDIPLAKNIFLRVENMLTNSHLRNLLGRFRGDWENDVYYPYLDNGMMGSEYAVHRGPNVSGICYDDPPDGMNGIYVLHCGPLDFFTGTSDGPYFIMKVGRSSNLVNRLTTHSAATGPLVGRGGAVQFLFGMEVDSNDTIECESLLLAKLTQLGFSRITVSDTQARSLEHFVFNDKSLPLVHDVVCALRYVFPLPAVRLTRNNPDSIENPILSQGFRDRNPGDLQQNAVTPRNDFPNPEFFQQLPDFATTFGHLQLQTPFGHPFPPSSIHEAPMDISPET